MSNCMTMIIHVPVIFDNEDAKCEVAESGPLWMFLFIFTKATLE